MGFDPVIQSLNGHLHSQARAEYDAAQRSKAQGEANRRNAAARAAYRTRALQLPHELCDLVTNWTEGQAGNPKQLGQALLDAVVRRDLSGLQLIVENLIRDDAAKNADRVSADDVLDQWRADEAAQVRADARDAHFDDMDSARFEAAL